MNSGMALKCTLSKIPLQQIVYQFSCVVVLFVFLSIISETPARVKGIHIICPEGNSVCLRFCTLLCAPNNTPYHTAGTTVSFLLTSQYFFISMYPNLFNQSFTDGLLLVGCDQSFVIRHNLAVNILGFKFSTHVGESLQDKFLEVLLLDREVQALDSKELLQIFIDVVVVYTPFVTYKTGCFPIPSTRQCLI